MSEHDVEPDYEVVVIGAGFSGIGAGIKLSEAGIKDFVILEKSDGVGGTWRDNTYPGVAVDITSFNYSFSFEPNPDWSRSFAPGHELWDYAEHCVGKYGLGPHLRFGVEVTLVEFDERQHLWRIHTSTMGVLTARFVLTATGGLTQPKLPDIPGLDRFRGRMFHTARWEHDYSLSGKRVAVIGTGASSVQVVPEIAREVEQLHVFQRTPIWVAPKPDVRIARPLRAAFRLLPPTQASLRLVTGAMTEFVMVLGLMYNKQLPQINKNVERLCRAHLRMQVPDPTLRAKLTPKYDFWCKRPTYSNTYLKAFMRDNVELVTEPIAAITEVGIRTADGTERELDCIVLATGFKVFELGNTPAFPLVGRDGVELGKFWHENRYQAYEGATVPGFPNMFAILGPYALTGPSYFSMIEAAVTHALRAIREAHRRGSTYVEIKQEPHDKYFADVQRRLQNSVFHNGHCVGSNSYYFDRHGDAPILRPCSGPELWWRARHYDLDDYDYRRP